MSSTNGLLASDYWIEANLSYQMNSFVVRTGEFYRNPLLIALMYPQYFHLQLDGEMLFEVRFTI